MPPWGPLAERNGETKEAHCSAPLRLSSQIAAALAVAILKASWRVLGEVALYLRTRAPGPHDGHPKPIAINFVWEQENMWRQLPRIVARWRQLTDGVRQRPTSQSNGVPSDVRWYVHGSRPLWAKGFAVVPKSRHVTPCQEDPDYAGYLTAGLSNAAAFGTAKRKSRQSANWSQPPTPFARTALQPLWFAVTRQGSRLCYLLSSA